MTLRGRLGWIVVGLALGEAVRLCIDAALGPRPAPLVGSPPAAPEPWVNGLRLGGWPDAPADPSLN